MRFVIVLAALLLATGGTVLARSADAPPTRPEGFRATLYDKAGGELFWQRSTDDRGAVRGYEITRNGESLGIRDALSYYDPSLEPGTAYTFTVVAVDNAGQRSGVATTTLGGDTAPPPASDGPDAPDGLRSAVYSRRAAELFWAREPAALRLRYEIRRDGQAVGTTNGVSYFTDDLAAGRDYAFEVIAIDREERRSRPSRTTVRTAGIGSPTPPAADAPDAPAALRADVYSARSAELFWRREPAVLALRYEIRRDEQVVGTTNGTSYYTRDLEAGTDYAFEVIAIGRDGARSRPANLLVGTSGTPAPPVLGPVEAPGNLRASVYSSRTAELFWDRSRTLPAPRYEIRRDGVVIATSDGTSYVDGGLTGGRTYVYEVTTIDPDDGRRSSASAVTLSTSGGVAPPEPADDPLFAPDPSGATTLARLGFPAARDLAVGRVSAAYLDPYLDIDETVGGLLRRVSIELEQTVRCSGGGTARAVLGGFRSGTLAFEDCVIDGRTLSGNLERLESRFPIAIGQIAELTVRFDGLRIDAGEAGTLTVTGSFERVEGSGQNARCNGYDNSGDTVTIASARLERDGDVSIVTDAAYSQRRSRQDSGDPRDEVTPCLTTRTFSIDGSASVVSSRFGAEAATISIRGEIARTSSGGTDVRTIPVIEADFGDGSALTVTATSDVEDTVQVDLLSGDVATSGVDDYVFGTRSFGITLF